MQLRGSPSPVPSPLLPLSKWSLLDKRLSKMLTEIKKGLGLGLDVCVRGREGVLERVLKSLKGTVIINEL